MKPFALTGAGGFVAPRHVRAIEQTGHRLVAVLDPCLDDPLGVGRSGAVEVFREEHRFAAHLEALRREGDGAVDYVAICSPSDRHDEQSRLALRAGADVICEKPVALDPRALDDLERLEESTGRRVWTVLQIRLHPAVLRLADSLLRRPRLDRGHEVVLTYVTARSPAYFESWKGDEQRSGGILTNIGIHFFDLVLWLFGPAHRSEIHLRSAGRAAGFLELERARVSWFLSVDPADLPARDASAASSVHRVLSIDGEPVDFSDSGSDLHTRLYERVLRGDGFGLREARPSLELVHRLRHASLSRGEPPHPFAEARAAAV